MFKRDQDYEVLDSSAQEEEELEDWGATAEEHSDAKYPKPILVQRRQQPGHKKTPFLLSVGLNAILMMIVGWQYLRLREYRSALPPYPKALYFPAQQAVEYELVYFSNGAGKDAAPGEESKYLGPPTEESDKAWDELYDIYGVSQLSSSEAAKWPDRTAKIPGSPGWHIAGLDVFHRLRCLNSLRMMLRPERYNATMDGDTEEQRASRLMHNGASNDPIFDSPGTIEMGFTG